MRAAFASLLFYDCFWPVTGALLWNHIVHPVLITYFKDSIAELAVFKVFSPSERYNSALKVQKLPELNQSSKGDAALNSQETDADLMIGPIYRHEPNSTRAQPSSANRGAIGELVGGYKPRCQSSAVSGDPVRFVISFNCPSSSPCTDLKVARFR